MQHTSKTILFFGTEDFSAYALRVLIQQGFSIGAIITKPDTRRGRHHELTKPLVKQIGEAHSIPVWQPDRLSDITSEVSAFEAPAGVLVSYGKIIPQSLIDMFSPGIINVHPSLLPRYRGPSPIEEAILQGDTSTGISIMQLSAAMDAGPVYLQEHIPLSGDETAPLLYEKLGTRGAELLAQSLPSILDGTLLPHDQDNAEATYCQLITKQNGIIDWSRDSAIHIERKIRAYADWPQVRACIGDIEVIITAAHIGTQKTTTPGSLTIDHALSTMEISTAHGSLAIDRVKPIGKKEMPLRAFLAGYSTRLR